MSPLLLAQGGAKEFVEVRLDAAPEAWQIFLILALVAAFAAACYLLESRTERRALKVPLALIRAAIIVLAVLILFRPLQSKELREIKNGHVVLAIDISGSMDARDFATPGGVRKQRLAGVRDVVSAFVAGREGDRMALIVFGSAAYLQAPLTDDLETIVALLDRTEVGMAGPHTALGDAIGLAIRTFEASEIEQRLLILLSDGSDTASRMSPVNAAEIAADRDVEIFSIGVGDPDATGEDRVDLATLRTVAGRSGGQYFFAEDERTLQEVYDRIDALAPRAVETLSFRPRQSLSWVALAAAAVIGTATVAVLQIGVARRRRGRRRTTGVGA